MKICKIALVGGGPSALFVLKKLVENKLTHFSVDIFESGDSLGMGMPYSPTGALKEHMTNVSSDEVPPLIKTLSQWVKEQDSDLLDEFQIDKCKFHDKTVVPRLLFGRYLQSQINQLISHGQQLGVSINIHLQSRVVDVALQNNNQNYTILLHNDKFHNFDKVVICTGHKWLQVHESRVAGYYDSPYPPQKLNKLFNHPIALKGSSLTAIDAIRALCHANGEFLIDNKCMIYRVNENAPNFKIVMHTLDGLLPSVRFHLDDPLVSADGMLSNEQLQVHKSSNDGFISLEYLFEHNFKNVIKKKDPVFYNSIANKDLETFVKWILATRKAFDPFTLLKIEYIQAERSIENQSTIHWKKLLALLSFTLNHPAKYFSGEDMHKLQTVLQPLIAIIIADIPQSSAEQLLALHESGRLEIIAVNKNSDVDVAGDQEFYYVHGSLEQTNENLPFKTFIDCTGQHPFSIADFPFKSIFTNRAVTNAKVKFKNQKLARSLVRDGARNIKLCENSEYWLMLEGFAINDDYQFIYADGSISENCFMMAVPYISGFNPDYSGFDFCDQVSSIIVGKLCKRF